MRPGVYVKKSIINEVPINIAQRYSVIVEANQPVDNYWIRATIAKECLLIDNATINANSAINFNVVGMLRYEEADDVEPPYTEPPPKAKSCKDLPSAHLTPYYPEPPLGPADETFKINITFAKSPERQTVISFINGVSFEPDFDHPTLQKIIDGVDPYSLPANQNAFVFDKPDSSIELRIFSKCCKR